MYIYIYIYINIYMKIHIYRIVHEIARPTPKSQTPDPTLETLKHQSGGRQASDGGHDP